MVKITYNAKLMKCISLFESLTRVQAKDCISQDPGLLFIVDPLDIGKAIGKNGFHAKKMEHLVKEKVRIVAFDEQKTQFLRNLLFPLNAFDVIEEGDILKIKADNYTTRGLIIGRNASGLRSLEKIMQRFFTVKEIV